MKEKTSFSNKKGGFAIIYVILIFCGLLLATGFLDILGRSFHMDEIQSTMDIAGVSSLQTGVDRTKLRVGMFDLDKHAVESTYKSLVSNRMSDNPKILSYRFIKTDVTFDANSTYGLGNTSKGRPQGILDSTVVIVVENSQMFDLLPGAYKTYYNSKDNKYFDVNYLGTTEDGKVELMIRSVTRIVYR